MNKVAKKKLPPVVGLRVTEEELRMFDVVREHLMRRSYSDVIRVLVKKEYEKILRENNTAVLS